MSEEGQPDWMNQIGTLLKVLAVSIGGSLAILLVPLLFRVGEVKLDDLWLPGVLAGAELGVLSCIAMRWQQWGPFSGSRRE